MRKVLLLLLAGALGAGAAALAGAAVHLPPRDALHLAWLAAAGGLVAGCAGSVGMLALRDPLGGATRLADDLQRRLEKLGVYERERRAWLPHLTVVRFRERLRLDPPLPELGEVVPSDAAAYHSVLRSTGAQYVVVDSFALGG